MRTPITVPDFLPCEDLVPARSPETPSVNYIVNAVADCVTIRIKTQLLERLQTPAPQIAPALLNVHEAAIYLGRSEQSIQHLIFDKELPVVRVGRRVHLDRRDLDSWIEKNKY